MEYRELEEPFGFDTHDLGANHLNKRLSASQRMRLRQQLPTLDRWWDQWSWAAKLLLFINVALLLIGLSLGIPWLAAVQLPSLLLIAAWWYRVRTGPNAAWKRVFEVSGQLYKYSKQPLSAGQPVYQLSVGGKVFTLQDEKLLALFSDDPLLRYHIFFVHLNGKPHIVSAFSTRVGIPSRRYAGLGRLWDG